MFSVQEMAEMGVENKFCKVDQVSPIPWILGETGFAATDDLLIPRELIHGDLQQLGDYSSFILDATCNCGGKGFSWWMYQEVDWGSGPSLFENYLGLLKYGTTPSSSPSPLKQPAANNFSSYVRGRNAPCPSDHTSQYLSTQYYYNPYQYPTTTQQLSSKIVDQNNLPIEYAKVLINSVAVDNNDPFFYTVSDNSFTFSDINSNFKFNQTNHTPPANSTWKFAQVIISGPGTE